MTRRAQSAGKQVAFLVELDGLHTIHLGEIGHLLTEEKLADIGSVDIACVPIGGPLLPTKAAELVAQLDPRIVVAMPLDDETAGDAARRSRSSSTRWVATPPRSRSCQVTISEPAGRDHGGPPGVPRQDLARARSRSRRRGRA